MEGLEIRFIRQPDSASNSLKDSVWSLLQAVNGDFVPALSSRSRIDDEALAGPGVWGTPIAYFQALMGQPLVVALLEDRLIGLQSLATHYSVPDRPDLDGCAYSHLLAVHPHFRRRKVATRLNDRFETIDEVINKPRILRRTWSTNEAQLALLKQRGFDEVHRIFDHRTDGVDTVFMARSTLWLRLI